MRTLLYIVIFSFFFMPFSFSQEQKDCSSVSDPREKEICFRANILRAKEGLKKLEKVDRDKFERRAEEQIRREEKDVARAQANVQLAGCPAGWPVWVNPRNSYPSSFAVYSAVRVVNKSEGVVDVESPHGGQIVMKNLCPGGSVTIFFRLIWDQAEHIPLIALSRQDGQVRSDRTTISLNRHDINYHRARNRVWIVNPTR